MSGRVRKQRYEGLGPGGARFVFRDINAALSAAENHEILPLRVVNPRGLNDLLTWAYGGAILRRFNAESPFLRMLRRRGSSLTSGNRLLIPITGRPLRA